MGKLENLHGLLNEEGDLTIQRIDAVINLIPAYQSSERRMEINHRPRSTFSLFSAPNSDVDRY